MADKINIESPVKIESDSKARVAFDLMERIDNYTGNQTMREDRTYWITLYCQCYRAASGTALKYILQED